MDREEHRSLIDDLARRVELGASERPEGQRAHFSDCWALAKRIGPAFRDTRYPTRAEKDGAWAAFQSAMEGLKAQQARRDAERETESEEARDALLSLADAGSPERFGILQGAYNSGEGLVGALFDLSVLAVTLGMVRPKPTDPKLQALKILSANHGKAWERFKEDQRRLTRAHHQEVYERLQEVRGELNRAWDDFKEEGQARYEERQRRREERRERQESFLAMLKGRLDSQREYLEKKNDQLRDLEEKRDGARSDGFRERVEGWIDECEEKIEEVENDIRQLEAKIEEVESKLNQSA